MMPYNITVIIGNKEAKAISPKPSTRGSRPGIFVSGAFQGPVDIPESVFSASGVSSKCGELLSHRRGLLAKEKVYPEFFYKADRMIIVLINFKNSILKKIFKNRYYHRYMDTPVYVSKG